MQADGSPWSCISSASSGGRGGAAAADRTAELLVEGFRGTIARAKEKLEETTGQTYPCKFDPFKYAAARHATTRSLQPAAISRQAEYNPKSKPAPSHHQAGPKPTKPASSDHDQHQERPKLKPAASEAPKLGRTCAVVHTNPASQYQLAKQELIAGERQSDWVALEVQRRREEARAELNAMRKTVEFDDAWEITNDFLQLISPCSLTSAADSTLSSLHDLHQYASALGWRIPSFIHNSAAAPAADDLPTSCPPSAALIAAAATTSPTHDHQRNIPSRPRRGGYEHDIDKYDDDLHEHGRRDDHDDLHGHRHQEYHHHHDGLRDPLYKLDLNHDRLLGQRSHGGTHRHEKQHDGGLQLGRRSQRGHRHEESLHHHHIDGAGDDELHGHGRSQDAGHRRKRHRRDAADDQYGQKRHQQG